MKELGVSLERLVELSQKKYHHMESILDLTEKQTGVLTEEKVEELTLCIEEKQSHIEAVNALDEEFHMIYQRIIPKLKTFDLHKDYPDAYKTYQKLQELITNIRSITQNIYRAEMKNNERIHESMNALKAKIKGINTAKKGYSAYKDIPKMGNGIFLDKKK